MSTRKSRRLPKQQSSKRRNHRAENIAVAVILTFCIVFALLININTHQARKDKLARTEVELKQKELDLRQALAIAKQREVLAQESFDNAEAVIAKYENSLSESIIAEHRNKKLIETYTILNDQLTEKVAKADLLESEQEKKLAELKKLREKTMNMRNSVLDFYHKTKKEKLLAEQQTKKADRAYSVSLARLNQAQLAQENAHQIARQADQTIAQNRALASEVNALRNDLSNANNNIHVIQTQVNTDHHNQHGHHERNHQPYCPPAQPKRYPKTPKPRTPRPFPCGT